MNKQRKLIAKGKQKWYVHAKYHIIKGFGGEQTYVERNDKHNFSDETVKSLDSLFTNKQQCLLI